MKRDSSPFRPSHFEFSPSKRRIFRLRNCSPQRVEPTRLLPVTPGPKSAPLRKPAAVPLSVENPFLDIHNRSVSIENRGKAFAAASAGKKGTEGVFAFQDGSPQRPWLDAMTEACSQLAAGQNQLKVRVRQHEIALQKLNQSKSPKPSQAEVIQEIRQYSRKSARKLWSRSETPNSRVQPAAYSQIPTPRANPPAISPAKDESFLTFESGIRGTEKVTYMRPGRFPRRVFMHKRKC